MSRRVGEKDSGYVSLDKRVKGACRCFVCSQNPDIVKWYVNDVLCEFDGFPCFSANYSGVRYCSRKVRGRVFHCSRFVVSKPLVGV